MSDGDLEDLLALIRTLPIPLARPDLPRADESLGLTFLSLVLRLPHVARITENLRYLDQHNLQRYLALDVDLRALTPEERELLRVRDYEGPSGGRQGSELWIPVSRYSRRDLAPVTVRNASGEVIPRLTQRATSGATAAGLVGLFKVLTLQVKAASDISSSARWLVESGIQQLVMLGQESVPLSSPELGDGLNSNRDLAVRQEAQRLARLVCAHANAFPTLLKLASEEYLLVVMLPEDQAQAHVTFEAPVVRSDDLQDADLHERRGAGRDLLERWLPSWMRSRVRRFEGAVSRATRDGEDFHFEYTTQLPRSVASYHVTVEVAEDIRIRRFLLTSDADSVPVGGLRGDMRALAGRVRDEAPERSGERVSDEVLKVELPRLLSALAELGRRRMYDLRAYGDYLSGEQALDGASWAEDAVRRDGGEAALLALSEGRCSLDVLIGLAELEAAGKLHARCLDPRHEVWLLRVLAPKLASAADELQDHELDLDVHAENDPREHGAHAQWRHRAVPFGRPTLEPITAKIVLALADEEPALIDSVRRMVTALLGVVLLLGALILEDGGEPQSDAIVAVLLIVPGILLARLDIPNTHSVLGQMRAGARRRAYMSVFITSALAVVVAAWSTAEAQARSAAGAGLLLLLVLLTILFNRHGRKASRRRRVPNVFAAPRWLSEAFDPGSERRRGPAQERFGANRGNAAAGDRPDVGRRTRSGKAGGGDLRRTGPGERRTDGNGGTRRSSPSARRGDDLGLRLGASLAQRGAFVVWEARPDAVVEVSHGPGAQVAGAPRLSLSGDLKEGLVCTWPRARVEWTLRTPQPASRSSQSGEQRAPVSDDLVRVKVSRPARLSPRTDAGSASTLEALLTLREGMAPEQGLAAALQELPKGVHPRAFTYPDTSFHGSVRPTGGGLPHTGPRQVFGRCLRLSLAWDGGLQTTRVDLLTRLSRTAGELGAGLHVMPARSFAEAGQWVQVRQGPERCEWRESASPSVAFTLVGGRAAPSTAGGPVAAERADEDRGLMLRLLREGRLPLESFVGASLDEHWLLSFVVRVDEEQASRLRSAERSAVGEADHHRSILIELLSAHGSVGPELHLVLARYDVVSSIHDAGAPRALVSELPTALPLWVQWELPLPPTRRHDDGNKDDAAPPAPGPSGRVDVEAARAAAGTQSGVKSAVVTGVSSDGSHGGLEVRRGAPSVLETVLVSLRRQQQDDGSQFEASSVTVLLERLERTSAGTLRGQAKLAVRLSAQPQRAGSEHVQEAAEHELVRRLGQLAKTAQDEARRSLINTGVEGSALSLSVVARDWWLRGWRGSI